MYDDEICDNNICDILNEKTELIIDSQTDSK